VKCNSGMKDDMKEYFQTIEDNFNRAIISNRVEEIKKCIAEDWALVDAQGGIIPGERFLQAVERGELSHSSMTKEILRVKVYGDMAVVTGRGQNRAVWRGQTIDADEWTTDIYRKKGENWLCVLTHLTPVKN